MSDRDILDEAFAALREEKRGVSADTSTRLAILAAASRRDRRRATVVKFVLPLAAVLVVSTAWAAATGRLSALSELFRPAPKPEAALPSNPPIMTGALAPPEAVDAGDTDAGDTVEEAEPSSAPVSVPAQPIPRVSASTVPRTNPSSARDGVDPEETLYRAAHAAHFVDHDWARALAGWDAYLSAHPSGRFAPEAQYNRALTLIRLGRRDQARAALRPFSEGTRYHGYRQREAASLLEALP